MSATLSNANQLAIVKRQTEKLETKAKESETALNLAALAQHIDVFERDHFRAHEVFQRSSEVARREASSSSGNGESLSLALLMHADFLQRTIHRRKLEAARGKGAATEMPGKEESKGTGTGSTSSGSPYSGMQLKELLEKAERLFQRALDCDHPHPMARGSYAIFLHMYKRDFDAAEAAYELALKEQPGHASVRCKAANFAKHIRRDLDRAERLYREALEVNAEHPDCLGNLAILLHGKGPAFYDEAEEHYVRAIEADPKHANNLGNYGLFLADARGDADKAETYYRKTLEVAPTHANTLYNLGVLFDTVRKDPTSAEGFYRRAIEVKPKHAYALYNVAVLLHHWTKDNQDRADEAERFYERAVAANSRDPLALCDFGSFLWEVRLGKMRESSASEKELQETGKRAIQFLAKAEKLCSGNNVDILFAYAKVLKSIGLPNLRDYEKAISTFERVVAINPNHVEALGSLANLYLDVREDVDRAGEMYKRCVRLEGARTCHLVNYADYLADFAGEMEEAETYYKLSLESGPNDSYALYNYACFLSRRKKDGSAAIALLRRALEVNAEDADALGELAYLEWQVLKDVESARKHFADAMRVAPEHGLNRGKLAQFVKVNGEL